MPVASPAPRASGRPEQARVDRVLLGAFLVALGIAVMPMVLGAVNAVRIGWVPFGDEAALGLRAADVFTTQSPLLGMPTSEIVPGGYAHHPGPLLFWFDAPFVLVLGATHGLIAAAAAMNAGAVTAIGVMTYLRRGAVTAIGALVACALVVGTLWGAGTIFRPFNPQVVVLPLLLVAFLSWWLSAGEERLLPVVVVVASVVVQADLAFLPVAAGATVFGVGALMVANPRRIRVRTPRPSGVSWLYLGQTTLVVGVLGAMVLALAPAGPVGALAGRVFVAGALAVVAAVVITIGWRAWRSRSVAWLTALAVAACWGVPLAEAVVNEGGNIARLTEYLLTPTEINGASDAAGAFAGMTGWPPVVFGHIDNALFSDALSPAVITGSVVWIALLVTAVRRRHSDDVRLLALAGWLVAVGALAAARVPVARGFSPQTYNWLPVVTVFFWFALARVGATTLSAVLGSPGRRAGARVLAAVVACLILIQLIPLRLTNLGFPYEVWIYEALPDVAAQVGRSIDRDSRFLVLHAGGRSYWELSNGLIANLEEGGTATTTENLANYYGHARDDLVLPADATLHVVPADLDHPPEDARIIATHRPAGWDQTAVEQLGREVRDHVRAQGPLALNASGRAELASTIYGWVPGACVPERSLSEDCIGPERFERDPDRLLDLPPLALLMHYRNDEVEAPALSADLSGRVDRELEVLPVDVYLGPWGH